jgi:CBS domain-containing protein
MEVSSIMRKVAVIEKDETIKQAIAIMSKRNLGSLVVVDGDKILGIITERDILKNLEKMNKSVKTIMKKSVKTIESGDDIKTAAEEMLANNVKKLPVLKEGKLVGIITMTDVLANHNSEEEDMFIFN